MYALSVPYQKPAGASPACETPTAPELARPMPVSKKAAKAAIRTAPRPTLMSLHVHGQVGNLRQRRSTPCSSAGGEGGAGARRTRASMITAPGGDQRVDVEFDHLGMSLHQRAQPQQHVLDRLKVAPLGAAVAVEQRKDPQGAQHLRRVEVGQRRDPYRHVAEQLGRGAPRATGDHGTEALIVDDPDEQLDPRWCHWLHGKALKPMAGAAQPSAHRAGRAQELARTLKPEHHPTRVALVHKPRRLGLERHWPTEL